MSSLINPMLYNPQLSLTDSSLSLPIIELPPEVQAILKPNMIARLEINLALAQGKFPATLQIDAQSFEVMITETLLNALNCSSSDSFVSLPLKVNTAGQLQILRSDIPVQPEIVQSQLSDNPLAHIQPAPLKIANFIDNKLKELNVPDNIRQQIASDIAPMEISLSPKGNTLSADNLLQPLNNILKQIAACPQDSTVLKPMLLQEINNLIGQKIIGEINSRVHDITILKTSLGETMFASPVKLPLHEAVIVTLNNQTPDFSRELKFLDNLLKLVLPSAEKMPSLKPETVHEQPFLQKLAVLEANTSAAVLKLVSSKLPFSGHNLLENIYNFYQGAISQDLSRWLGQATVKEIVSAVDKGTSSINELNNFIASSLKETPGWRIVEMPLFDGNQFAPLKIAVKKDKEDRSKPKQNKVGTRFIVETTFSQLGDFQFDGFASAAKRNFDLIIRTSKQMDEDFCFHIINLFNKSLYNLQYVGTLKINRQEAFINMQEENFITEGIYI